MAALIRLLAIAALFFMPIGMGAVPAAAAPDASHLSMSGQDEGHCGQTDKDDPDGSMAMQCTGTCSAFPGEAAALKMQELAPVASQVAGPVKVLHGVQLSLSTPPPRVG